MFGINTYAQAPYASLGSAVLFGAASIDATASVSAAGIR